MYIIFSIYRMVDITKEKNFTYEELLKILDETPKFEVTIMNPKDFVEYNQFLLVLL